MYYKKKLTLVNIANKITLCKSTDPPKDVTKPRQSFIQPSIHRALCLNLMCK